MSITRLWKAKDEPKQQFVKIWPQKRKPSSPYQLMAMQCITDALFSAFLE